MSSKKKKSASDSPEKKPEFKSLLPQISEECGVVASALIKVAWQWPVLT